MRITYKQKFHSVGQGLFYTSELLLNNNVVVNAIFDCGAENIGLITEEIDNYSNRNIDLLIISHLHYDHVSGLDYLLKNRKVNTVILPYLCQEERIILQLLNVNKPVWYNAFLFNPYSYLNEFESVENVIIINGDGEDDNYSVNVPEEFPPLNDNLNNEKSIKIHLENTNENTRSTISKSELIQFTNKLSLMKDKGYILISNMYFSFFNYKINDSKKIIDFRKKIISEGITDTKSVLALLKDEKKRVLIKECYEILRTDLNITSLATYQGFILPFSRLKHSISFHSINAIHDNFLSDLFCCDCDGFIEGHFHGRFSNDCKYKFYVDCYCDCHKHCHGSKMTGTLLLGDIKLDYKSKKRKELFIHFKTILPSVKLIQLSHHGAKNGWSNNLIAKIMENCVYLASYGISNKYHHPHKKVLIELAENHRKYLSVTENNEYNSYLEFDI